MPQDARETYYGHYQMECLTLLSLKPGCLAILASKASVSHDSKVYKIAHRPSLKHLNSLWPSTFTNTSYKLHIIAPKDEASLTDQRLLIAVFNMSTTKRRREDDLDSPESKLNKTNGEFTVEDFMADFPPLKGPIAQENESPLPSTILTADELQDLSNGRKPPFRSTFNVSLPLQLKDYNQQATINAPYNWMKKQYSHCIIPELGEEYDFAYESDTFHTLRDFHNARVRIREGQYLPDYIIHSLATRWLMLEEKGRPASDGYLAQGEILVAACLPLSDDSDALNDYFEENYLRELSAQYYIPRSKYSVHFVGQPNKNQNGDIQSVHVGSVLIRNTRTGHVIHIDTGVRKSLENRSRLAGGVLKSWLEFQKEKRPDADLGPISSSAPLILDVTKETHPTLRSIHAPASATLFLKRRIINWGDVKAFHLRNVPSSKTMANCALRSISGWLGLRVTRDVILAKPYKTPQTFADNYDKMALGGRPQRAPKSQRIQSAKKGEQPVYNDDAGTDVEPGSDNDHEAVSDGEVDPNDEAIDDEGSIADTVHESVSGDEDSGIVDQPSDDDNEISPDGEVRIISDEESEYSEDEHGEIPKKDESKKVEPKKNASINKRAASEDLSDKKSGNARQAKGKAGGRNLRSSP